MKKIITSVFIFFIILVLSISIILAKDVTNNSNLKIDTEKIYYEIKYYDSKIIYIANLLNNNQIEWKKIEQETYSLYNYWNSVILDLSNLDINRTDLTSFGKKLDELALSVKYNNKKEAFNMLLQLYNQLIIYVPAINYQNYENILLTKYNLLTSCSMVELGNWTLAYEYVLNASNKMYTVMNTLNNNEYLQYNVNQSYVAIKEIENLINIKDFDLFYFKYNIAINKLQNI